MRSRRHTGRQVSRRHMSQEAQTVHGRFRSVAERCGGSPALLFRSGASWESWTYPQLAERANAITAALLARGVQPGASVGIVPSRTPHTIAGLIGTLQAGACYVPIDLSYPAERVSQLVQDAGIRQMLSGALSCNASRLPPSLETVDCATLPTAAAPELRGSADQPAYVMFTSGSTGQPKGVVVPHRAIRRLVDGPNFMALGTGTAFLHLAPLAFDASTLEIWGPLLNGGTCVLFPESELPTPPALGSVIRQGRVNAAWLTSSLFNVIVDQDPSSLDGLKELLIGGEALSVPHVVKAQRALPGTQIINGYGPTENTTFTTCYRIPPGFPAHASSIPIGVPISGTDVLIVDEALRPVADGSEGELVALGDGLALEYLGRPEATQERFVSLSVAGKPSRGYRTGDRVIRRPDGLIDYLGRFDDQVKIDGHRIEPGEIERIASRLPGVRECRVVVRLSPTGQKRLVAYVVSAEPDAAELRSRLSESLPGYMVPHFILFVDALPLTANGKLDKARLPDPFAVVASPLSGDLGEVAQVFEAWKSILGHGAFGEDVNFFDAGGTSLEAVKLQALLGERLGRPLAATFVFEHPTMRRQAAALRGASAPSDGPSRGAQRRQALSRAGRGAA